MIDPAETPDVRATLDELGHNLSNEQLTALENYVLQDMKLVVLKVDHPPYEDRHDYAGQTPTISYRLAQTDTLISVTLLHGEVSAPDAEFEEHADMLE